MRVLTVVANPNPKSFCHALLKQFVAGLEEAGHANETIDLYAERFDPVFRVRDFNSYVHESMPLDVLESMNLRQRALDTAGGPLQRFLLSRVLANKDARALARLAWEHVESEENNKAFGRRQSFVAGHPKNGVQFMVKDSRRYASTGGWGFAHFDGGKPADEAVHNTCVPCHETVKARDFIFNRYAP